MSPDRRLQVRFRQQGHIGIGFVSLHTNAACFHQGVLVLDDPNQVPVPCVDARLDDIEILEASGEARQLLRNAGYHLVGL